MKHLFQKLTAFEETGISIDLYEYCDHEFHMFSISSCNIFIVKVVQATRLVRGIYSHFYTMAFHLFLCLPKGFINIINSAFIFWNQI